MDLIEKTTKVNYLYKGKILNLRKDDIVLPDGNPAIREIVEHSGGSCIVCEKDGKFLLVRQFRYPYKKEIWEIPAGKLNVGETPEQTAKRELEEEGGIIAEELVKLTEVYPSPGYTEEVIHIYKTTKIKEGKVHLDEDEFLDRKWFPKEQLLDMIAKGELQDAKTIIGLLMAIQTK